MVERPTFTILALLSNSKIANYPTFLRKKDFSWKKNSPEKMFFDKQIDYWNKKIFKDL